MPCTCTPTGSPPAFRGAALVGRPALLILDEPTVGLDPLLRRKLWTFFAELAAGGTTLLVSSHVMDEAEHCDNLILMREGAVLAADSRTGLLAKTGRTSAEDAFLAVVGKWDVETSVLGEVTGDGRLQIF